MIKKSQIGKKSFWSSSTKIGGLRGSNLPTNWYFWANYQKINMTEFNTSRLGILQTTVLSKIMFLEFKCHPQGKG